MIKFSIKLFSDKKKILKCELNFLSKKLNQKLNEYLISDALQANKVSVETSQKFSTKLSLTNKILNMKLCQSESIMSETFEFDDDYFQKSQWFSHEKIEEYNESWDFSRKTDFLLSVFLYSEFCISVSILSELNIIHFSQHFSAHVMVSIMLNKELVVARLDSEAHLLVTEVVLWLSVSSELRQDLTFSLMR